MRLKLARSAVVHDCRRPLLDQMSPDQLRQRAHMMKCLVELFAAEDKAEARFNLAMVEHANAWEFTVYDGL